MTVSLPLSIHETLKSSGFHSRPRVSISYSLLFSQPSSRDVWNHHTPLFQLLLLLSLLSVLSTLRHSIVLLQRSTLLEIPSLVPLNRPTFRWWKMASNRFHYCLLWLIALIGLASPLAFPISNGNDTGQSNIMAATEHSSEVSMEGGYKSIAYFVDWVGIPWSFQTNPTSPS